MPNPPLALLARLLPVLAFGIPLAVIAFHTERYFGSLNLGRFILAFCLFAGLHTILVILTRRKWVSAYGAFTILVGLAIVSKLKFDYTAMTLHAFDLYYYLGAWTELAFFGRHYPELAAAGGGTLLALVAVGFWIWRLETPRRSGRGAAARAAAACMSIVVAGSAIRDSGDAAFGHSYDVNHVTAPLFSLTDIFQVGSITRYFPGRPISPAPLPVQQVKAQPPVNIILVLHESTIDPRRYVDDARTQMNRDPFVSGDGTSRLLIVETYGGITWISEYGVLLGLSTHYFRPIQAYLGHFMRGRFKTSLPQHLTALGYGRTLIYPAPKNFANTAAFYKSLSFEEILDFHDQTPSFWVQRDQHHFNYAIENLKKRRAANDMRPSFLFILTSATHAPWSVTFFPEQRVDEARVGDQWAEYARRIRIGHDDMEEFKKRLSVEFPNERFLIVGFGDHQPTLTSTFHNDDVLKRHLLTSDDLRRSAMFDSFYRLEGVNFEPKYAKAPAVIEIGYLANVILEAAGLPLDEAFTLRRRLMDDCKGLWFRCGDQNRVVELHRRLVEIEGIVVD